MTHSALLLVIVVGAVGTQVFRLLPILLPLPALPDYWKKALDAVPAAAMGALLVPGAGRALPSDQLWLTLGALFLAVLVAFRTKGILFPVLSAMATVAAGLALLAR